jgi:hypothetical protein
MWFENYVFSLLANNVVSFADNVVLRAWIFSINVVRKMRCLQFLAPMFAVHHTYLATAAALGRFRRNAGRIHSGTAVVITSVPLVGFTGIAEWRAGAKANCR